MNALIQVQDRVFGAPNPQLQIFPKIETGFPKPDPLTVIYPNPLPKKRIKTTTRRRRLQNHNLRETPQRVKERAGTSGKREEREEARSTRSSRGRMESAWTRSA